MDPFFSVIIRSHLQPYEGAATERLTKLDGALQSVLNQLVPNTEIIVVADGCPQTIELIKTDARFSSIKLVEIPEYLREQRIAKEIMLGVESGLTMHDARLNGIHHGTVCQAGIDAATGKYLIFCDADDFYGPNHLLKVEKGLHAANYPDFAYFDSYRYMGPMPGAVHPRVKTKLRPGQVGNGMICWKRELNVSYFGCNGYGHDWKFVQQILGRTKSVVKLETWHPEYYVCHEPGNFDH